MSSYSDTAYTTDNDYPIPNDFDVGFSDPAPACEFAALQAMCDNEVLAWIAFARRGGFNHRSGNCRLSDEQVIAISALTETDDGLVVERLSDSRAKAQRG